MILFANDWNAYPTAIADTQTTNVSWVRLASVLKTMGIKNYDFHLALLQPELQGVDPYSLNLTADQQTKIALEIEYNPWYFFREIARIPDGNTPMMVECNRAILSVIWCFFVNIDYALILVRQCGKSTLCDILEIYLLYFYYRGRTMILLTKDSKLK
jgi:hypothetical protein